MQTSQKLKTTTPANENQADFGRKDTKIRDTQYASRDTQYEFRVSDIFNELSWNLTCFMV